MINMQEEIATSMGWVNESIKSLQLIDVMKGSLRLVFGKLSKV